MGMLITLQLHRAVGSLDKSYGRAIVAVASHLAEAAFWVRTKDEDYRPPRARSTEERATGGFVISR
jgi:hypothetical protein